MITYCKKCVMPEIKPDLHIDEDDICGACRSYDRRKELNWRGTGSYQDLFDVIETAEVAGVAAASMFHFSEQTPGEALRYLKEKSGPVRYFSKCMW